MKANIKSFAALASKVGNDELEQLSNEEADELEGGKGVNVGCSTNDGCGANTGCGKTETTTTTA
jgi:hypothetical protein